MIAEDWYRLFLVRLDMESLLPIDLTDAINSLPLNKYATHIVWTKGAMAGGQYHLGSSKESYCLQGDVS